ncbi:zinc finger protein ZIC 5-like [Ischnura elegans]|uniref:zinc finger protein ZIC 5-like n=1 Tax=Ischnura elegans TaxID=197161 RepID=UPI001ED87EF0|nr:zinc finger protein ZIC 5-like [Ischnura elegans]
MSTLDNLPHGVCDRAALSAHLAADGTCQQLYAREAVPDHLGGAASVERGLPLTAPPAPPLHRQHHRLPQQQHHQLSPHHPNHHANVTIGNGSHLHHQQTPSHNPHLQGHQGSPGGQGRAPPPFSRPLPPPPPPPPPPPQQQVKHQQPQAVSSAPSVHSAHRLLKQVISSTLLPPAAAPHKDAPRSCTVCGDLCPGFAQHVWR